MVWTVMEEIVEESVMHWKNKQTNKLLLYAESVLIENPDIHLLLYKELNVQVG